METAAARDSELHSMPLRLPRLGRAILKWLLEACWVDCWRALLAPALWSVAAATEAPSTEELVLLALFPLLLMPAACHLKDQRQRAVQSSVLPHRTLEVRATWHGSVEALAPSAPRLPRCLPTGFRSLESRAQPPLQHSAPPKQNPQKTWPFRRGAQTSCLQALGAQTSCRQASGLWQTSVSARCAHGAATSIDPQSPQSPCPPCEGALRPTISACL
mmetsp:Transcript_127259/g.302296  ORF Transcript_127259/g.302296 Transcript_127259/m.302296 type:complete len:217 (-) Transcript_127259:3541-4191(-)